MKKSTDLESALKRFLPESSLDIACELLRKYPHHLTITQPRSTKHGDFRAGMKGQMHEISVNGNLNPYAFLITLMHELAHLVAHLEFGQRIKPHGEEWKQSFRLTMRPFIGKDVFPSDIEGPLKRYLVDPGATTHSDYNLFAALTKYDRRSDNVHILNELPANTIFKYGRERRSFKKGNKLRKRIQCVELSTGSVYLFDPLAKVQVQTT